MTTGQVWPPATFLGGLAPAAAAELIALGVGRRFEADQPILREGGTDDHAVLLIDGFVKVTTAVQGFETLLGIRVPGEVVGEIGALTAEPRNATVTACGQVTARMLSRPVFQGFVRRHSATAALVTAAVARQLRWANRRRSDFTAFRAEVRLARLLVEIAEVCGRERPGGGIELLVPLSQPELAAMIGIAQATVEKAVRDLRAQNLIDTGYRRIILTDPVKLRGLADEAGR